MSAIKYVGRTLWKVCIRYNYLSGRAGATLWIATKGKHVNFGIRSVTNLLFQNENYPESDIVSIERMGEIDA